MYERKSMIGRLMGGLCSQAEGPSNPAAKAGASRGSRQEPTRPPRSGPQPWASRCSWTSTPRNLGQQRWWRRLLGVVAQEHLEAQGWSPLP